MKSILFPILAAGLIATAPAAPARADAQEIAGVLAGVVTLGLIAKAINDRNERDRERARAVQTTRTDAPRHDTWRPLGTQGERKARNLPEWCRTDVGWGGPERDAYDRECLQQTFASADRLPRRCEWKTRTADGWRSVYGAECLSRAGFQTEDRWARR